MSLEVGERGGELSFVLLSQDGRLGLGECVERPHTLFP